jgi:hypothetical protein
MANQSRSGIDPMSGQKDYGSQIGYNQSNFANNVSQQGQQSNNSGHQQQYQNMQN